MEEELLPPKKQTIEEFILERCAAMRAVKAWTPELQWDTITEFIDMIEFIVEWHKNWPVLVQKPMEFGKAEEIEDLNSMAYRVTQEIAWLTTQEYRARFGDEPPTGTLLLRVAAMWKTHPGYQVEWTL